jgi:phage major head subunit gpT-like protein
VRAAMRQQTAYGDTKDVLSIVPQTLIVPSSLEELAWQLATSLVALPSGAPVGAATDIPNIHSRMNEPIVVDYYSDQNDWYVVATRTMVPTIEVGFYNGRQDPELFTQSDPTVGSMFDADKVTYKIRHIYGAVLDHRGFYRNTL